MLNQSLVTEDKYEHIKHNPSSKVCNWICQAITWILLICLIVSLVIKGFYSGIFIPGFFFLVAYLTYLAINFSSKESILFRYYKKDGSMFSVMESLFKTAPLIRMKSSSFHYFNQEKKAQIFSYKDIQTFPYLSYRDVSGLFLLDLKDATTNDKSYIVHHLKKEINFADTLTYNDYIIKKTEFWKKNRYYDIYMEYQEERLIEGFMEDILMKVDGSSGSIFMTSTFFWICTFLTMSEFYKLYFNSRCIHQSFTIRKLISTHYNLNDEERLEKYTKLQPALSLCNQMFVFGTEKTGSIDILFKSPSFTEEEAKKAEEQYKPFIANYEVSTMRGKSGVVKDLPNYNEENFNLPPPEFAGLGGNMELDKKLIKPVPISISQNNNNSLCTSASVELNISNIQNENTIEKLDENEKSPEVINQNEMKEEPSDKMNNNVSK